MYRHKNKKKITKLQFLEKYRQERNFFFFLSFVWTFYFNYRCHQKAWPPCVLLGLLPLAEYAQPRGRSHCGFTSCIGKKKTVNVKFLLFFVSKSFAGQVLLQ